MSEIRFRGVRGSIPTPDRRMLGYGGNTSCIEVTGTSRERIILDAGTGLVGVDGEASREHHIFLTHFHRDHIEGIPFFTPLHDSTQSIVFHTPAALGGLRQALEGFMRSPYTPVPLADVASRIEYDEFDGCTRVGDFVVQAFELNHPQRAFGYRVEHNGTSLVYASDYEHGHPTLDSVLRTHAEGANVLICDTQFTPEEYEAHRGWGHSTWLEAARIANESHAGQLILFHHSPERTDAEEDLVVQQAQQHFPQTAAAREEKRFTETRQS